MATQQTSNQHNKHDNQATRNKKHYFVDAARKRTKDNYPVLFDNEGKPRSPAATRIAQVRLPADSRAEALGMAANLDKHGWTTQVVEAQVNHRREARNHTDPRDGSSASLAPISRGDETMVEFRNTALSHEPSEISGTI